MYTRLSRETGIELDYEPAGSYQALDWTALKDALQRYIPKLTKTGDVPCAQ